MSIFTRMYKHRVLSAGLVGAFLVAAGQAQSAEFAIDLFTEPQNVSDANDGGAGVSSSVSDSGSATILGGHRDINANALSGAENSGVPCVEFDKCSRMHIGGGTLTFNNDTGLIGTGIVQWDGSDGSIALNPVGLREGEPTGVDLTFGGQDLAIEFTTEQADQGFVFSIGVYTDATHYMIYTIRSTIVNSTTGPDTRTIPLSVFEQAAFCGNPDATMDDQILSVECGPGNQTADMSNLGAMEVKLNVPDPENGGGLTTALDMRIRDITGEYDDEEPLACRVTGGGVTTDDTYPEWDGSLAEGEEVTSLGTNRYQFGGQAGASTALDPQPWGNWEHHQQRGPAGRFSFHTGTRSAPAGTEIIDIRCSDPDGCSPSGTPPSPNKQLDFDCIGTFQNIGSGRNAPIWLDQSANVTAEGNGNRDFDGTFHYCEVNIDDNGEGPDSAEPNTAACPADGFGEKSGTALSNCDCPDFYRITIYDGVDADTEDLFLPDGNIDLGKMNTTTVIYEVEGYLGRGGNGLQLHFPTGRDR